MPDLRRDLAPALSARVRAAVARARATTAEAEALTAAARLLRDPTAMAKRCAWCGRLAIGRRWVPEEEMPDYLRAELEERMTHGICADCIRRLEREGASRPVRR